MAKVMVSNTREHVVHLNINKQNILIPASRQDPDDRSKIIHGKILIEQEHIEAAKKHPVANHYFKEGWLRVEEKKTAAQPQQ